LLIRHQDLSDSELIHNQNISLSLGLSQENLSFVNPGPQIINYL